MATLDNKLVPLSGLKIAYDDISSKLETTYATKEDVSDKTASAVIVKSNLDANGSYTLPTGKLYNEVSVNLGKASAGKSSVTPSTVAQTVIINPGFLKEAASVTVNAIPNQKTKVVETLSVSATAAQTITIPAGYYTEASTVTLPKQNAVTVSSTSITPTTSTQTVTVSAGWNASADTITVNPINATVLNNLDSDFAPSNIKKDVEIFGVKGTFTETSNGASAANIIKDKEAWVNGGKITGSMPNAVIKSGTVTPKFTGPTYDSTAGNFTVSVSGTIAAPTVSTAGYISTDVGTKNTNSLSGSKTLNRIKLNTSSSGSLTYTPEISKGTKATDDTWVDAAKSAATKTKPTSGPHVKVSTAAKKGTLTITPKVATAGYGTTTDGQSEATPWSNTIGANASGDYYIPIKEITYGSVTTTAPNSTNYPDVFSGGITPSTSAKYVQIDAGYSFNRSIKIKAVPTETKTVTPSTSSLSVTPTTGKFLSKVTVNPASAMYQSVSIAKDDWNSSKQCTKTVTGMTSSCSVMMRCTADSGGLAGSGQVLCTAQASNSLTFTYSSSSKPSGTITFDVVWYGY